MDFHSLPRKELQALCKKNRIPANMTNVAMADALQALNLVEGVGELQEEEATQFLATQKPEARAGADAPQKSRRASTRKLPAASVEPKEQQASPLPRARRVTAKVSEIMRSVAEGEGNKIGEKGLGAYQVAPPAPAVLMVKETIPRITKKRSSKKEEANEEGRNHAVEATTIQTPAPRNDGRRTTTRRTVTFSSPVAETIKISATRNGGRRTTTRRAIATSAPVVEEVGNDAVEATTTQAPAPMNGGRRTTSRRAVATSAPVAEEVGNDAAEATTIKTSPTRNGGQRATTRRAVATSEPVDEEVGDDVVEATTIKTFATRNGGRRTSTRRAVATSAPVDEEGGNDAVEATDIKTFATKNGGRRITTRRAVATSAPVDEKVGKDEVVATTIKTFATRNGGRRTTTRRAVATSAPVDEEVGNNVVKATTVKTSETRNGSRRNTTRRAVATSTPVDEEVGNDALEVRTSRILETRNGSRRTTTRGAVATSAPAEEAQEEQMLAPSRTVCRTRQTATPPASDSVPASVPLRRSTRARNTVSKMSPLAPEDTSQQEKDVETVDSLDSGRKLQELDVVQETSNSVTETCPSVIYDVNQILGKFDDDKLMKEKSQQQEEGFEVNDSCNKEDDELTFFDNKSSEKVLEENMRETSEICDTDYVKSGELVAEIKTICHGEEESHQSAEEDEVLAPSDSMSSEIEEVLEEKMGDATEIYNPDPVQGEKVAEIKTLCQGEEESHQLSEEDDVLALSDNVSSEAEEILEEKMGETTEICNPDCDESEEKVAEIETSCQGEEESHQSAEEDNVLTPSNNMSFEVEELLEEKMGEATEICNPDLVELGEKVAEVETICQGEEDHQSTEEDDVFVLSDNMSAEAEEVLEENMGKTTEICKPDCVESGEQVAEVETICQGEEEIHRSVKEDDVLVLSINMPSEVEEVLEEKMVETTEICDPDCAESGEQVVEVETICQGEEESHQSAKESDVLAPSDNMSYEVEELLEEKMGETTEICDPICVESGEQFAEVETICQGEEENHQSVEEDNVFALSDIMSSEVEEVLDEKMGETIEICDPYRDKSGEKIAEVETIHQGEEEIHQSAKEDDVLALSKNMSSEVEEVLEEKMVETTEICDPDSVESGEQVEEVETICQAEEECHQSAEEDNVLAPSDNMSNEVEELLEEKMGEATEICNPELVESGEKVAEVETICQEEEENHQSTEEDDVLALSDNMSAEAEEVLEEKMGETTEICKLDCVESGEQVAEVETICQGEEKSHQSVKEEDVFALSDNMSVEAEEVLEEKMGETTEICKSDCVESGEQVAEVETICQGEEENHQSVKEDNVLALSNNMPSEVEGVLEEKTIETTEICVLDCVESGEQVAEVETIYQGEEETVRSAKEDDVLALSDNMSSEDEEVLEEKMGGTTEICDPDRVESGEQFAEVETIWQGEEESHQASNSLSELEGSPILRLIFSFHHLMISEVEDQQSMQDENSLVVQETKDADTVLVVGQEVEVESFSLEDFVTNEDVADNQSMEDEDKSFVVQDTEDADTVGGQVEVESFSLEDFVTNEDVADNQSSMEDEDKSFVVQETKDGDTVVGQQVEVESFSFEDFVTNEDVADSQISMEDKDKNFVIQETKEADTVVGQQVEVENFSFKDFVINVVADNQRMVESIVLQETKDGNIVLVVDQEVEVAENQSTQDEDKSLELEETKDAGYEDKSLELGETKDASYDLFVVQEVESENLSAALVEGSGESSNSQDTNASGNGGAYEILAEEQLSIGKTQSDLELMLDSDDIADDADFFPQKIPSPASNLQNLTESTGEILVLKSVMAKDCAEPPSEKLGEVSAKVENTTEHVVCLEAEEIGYSCANYSSESQDSNAANKENTTGRTVLVEENKVKGNSESDKQDVDLKHFSSRKLKPLLQEKISSDSQKTEKKRAALAQLDENRLQRAS